ncbi:MAG: T9SS type A sorting domain-containing protein [Bacteroidota bacterium]
MKKLLLICFLTIFSQIILAQNLVPNPSFEIYDTCPNGLGQVYKVNGWNIRINTPDYFNSCNSSNYSVPNAFFGYQNAATGTGICGLYVYNSLNLYGREFLGCKLNDSLVVGQKYYISLKLNLPNTATCAVNKLSILFSTVQFVDTLCHYSVYFSDNALILSDTIINDTLNWVLLKTTFIADSSYDFLIVGNFFENHLIDTVLFSGNTCISYYYIDDICISKDSLYCNTINNVYDLIKDEDTFFIYPNPTSDFINIKINTSDAKTICCKLFDLYGRLIDQKIIINSGNINVTNYSEGVYVLQMKIKNTTLYKKIIINH